MASPLLRQNPISPRLGFVLPPLLENFLTPTLTSPEPTLSFTRAFHGGGSRSRRSGGGWGVACLGPAAEGRETYGDRGDDEVRLGIFLGDCGWVVVRRERLDGFF
jgi:hypothetical protein